MEIRKATTQSDFFSIMMIRAQVFMCEQQVDPMIELDEEDKTCDHYLLKEDHKVIGCLRVLQTDNIWHLGRIAILNEYRAKHFGSFLLEKIEAIAKSKHIDKLTLGAQVQAVPFYEKNGFHICGAPYEEANIQHLSMEKTL